MLEKIKEVLKPAGGLPAETLTLIRSWGNLTRIWKSPVVVLEEVKEKHGRDIYIQACRETFTVLRRRFGTCIGANVAISFDPVTGVFTLTDSLCGHDTIQTKGCAISHPAHKEEGK